MKGQNYDGRGLSGYVARVNKDNSIARKEPADEIVAVRARDNRLVLRTIAGDGEAFEDLVRLYYDRIRALVFHHLHREDDLDDALQEIFLKAWQALPNFQKRSNFYTWLFRIASNYCIDRLRKRRLELVSLDGTEARDALEARAHLKTDTPEEEYSRSERVRIVQKAIGMLDPIYQNIIILREIEGLTYDELADSLDIEMGTVKSRLARARTELKKILQDMDVI
ncbi:MAG: sigma-70 family RNA polymerase sigma factor [bacterium]|nr:sigma-70 family RNA polymerase sigma factor [bacterium]